MPSSDVVTVGMLCARRPLATVVLRRLGISFRDPDRALAAAELADVARAEAELAASWEAPTLGELLDRIVRTYHRPFEVELAVAITAVERVQPDATDPAYAIWARLRREVDELRADMEQHMVKEERVLFPWLRGRAQTAGAPIRAMLLEHGDTIQLLHAIDATLDAWLAARGPDAALATAVEHVATWLCEHMHVEAIVVQRMHGRDA